MSRYKLLCLDIDGTLLNSNHKITEGTKQAIEKVAKQRIPVVLVSARMPKGIRFLAQALALSSPIICYSGALIVDNEQFTASKYISRDDIEQIQEFVGNCHMHLSLYREDEWYIEKVDAWARQEAEITKINPCIGSFDRLLAKWPRNSGCHKLLCMGKPEEISLLKDRLQGISGGRLAMYLSKPTYLEIMPQDACKTTAIAFLVNKYNIARENVAAIGDNFNDIDMLQYAGLGIAMGNAPEEVKKYANKVTLSNDEDGVAYAIHRYILV